MKRSTLIWLIGTAVIMLGMPGAARFAGSDGFMVLIVLEFFIVGPLWSLATGIFSGWNGGTDRWWLAVANPLLFLSGAWAFLEMWELDFLYYAFCYLMVGLLSTFATAIVRQKFIKK